MVMIEFTENPLFIAFAWKMGWLREVKACVNARPTMSTQWNGLTVIVRMLQPWFCQQCSAVIAWFWMPKTSIRNEIDKQCQVLKISGVWTTPRVAHIWVCIDMIAFVSQWISLIVRAIVNVHQEWDAVTQGDRFEFRATQGPHMVWGKSSTMKQSFKETIERHWLCDPWCNLNMLQWSRDHLWKLQIATFWEAHGVCLHMNMGTVSDETEAQCCVNVSADAVWMHQMSTREEPQNSKCFHWLWGTHSWEGRKVVDEVTVFLNPDQGETFNALCQIQEIRGMDLELLSEKWCWTLLHLRHWGEAQDVFLPITLTGKMTALVQVPQSLWWFHKSMSKVARCWLIDCPVKVDWICVQITPPWIEGRISSIWTAFAAE